MATFLTDAQMSINGGIASSASQVLILAIGNMLMCTGIPVLLGQAEINNVDQIAFLAKTHQKVVWFDVSVNEILRVDVLNATDLEGQKQAHQ